MKKYWKSIEELNQKSTSKKEESKKVEDNKNPFLELMKEMNSGNKANRRDFLKLCGFSLTAATLVTSCEAPVTKAIPFLIKPEEVTSGVANYYASSFIDGSEYCSILVKTREGRPIKIEGNDLSSITKGGTNARVQASVLSLYDEERLQYPLHKQNKTTWQQVDDNVIQLLKAINTKNGKIVILSSTIISPSTKQLYNDFVKTYPNTKIVYYDAISFSAMLTANKNSFGKQIIPGYNFDRANVIVSFGADFLGTWLSPVEFTKQYVVNRKLDDKKTMSRHIQFETTMSLTGSNADERHTMRPSEEGSILIDLYNELLKLSGSEDHNFARSNHNVISLAKELWSNQTKSLVISNSTNESIQTLVNAINILLKNYGNTIDLQTPLNLKQGIDEEMDLLVDDMINNKIDALIINNVNPAYDYFEAEKFCIGLKNLKLSISLSDRLDETSTLVNYVCPDNHYLESWNDAEPKRGYFSLAQPAINRLFDTRSAQESLLKWTSNERNYLEYIQQYWKKNIYPLSEDYLNKKGSFIQFWNKCLQNGVFEVASKSTDKIAAFKASISDIIIKIINIKAPTEIFELHTYESISMGNGKYANNPWLQELPDPISKVCWDNYAAISPFNAEKLNLENGDIIQIDSGDITIEMPVLLQPGQAYNTLSIALGYGRKNAGKVGNKVGFNAFRLKGVNNGFNISDLGKKHVLALTQTHNSMEGRDIVRETTLSDFINNPSSGNEMHEKFQKEKVSLYEEPVHIGYHWSLSIDLNACTGCGNCIIACQAENNVPVIGKEEVVKRRIMHWLRIDRYYSDSVDNPQVYHQPVMCQHCDNAPCENVCPVSATAHSDDGLNHMTYNRCIGTRYCMNNCPYKVRRFNWYQYSNNDKFDFNMNSDYGRMVLNPDVVVRSRGVAEKCTMCVQRIQEKKAQAKLENRLLSDNEIKPACLQSCPANAIVFGNTNDEKSDISKKFKDKRNYGLLEEIHALPSVGYLVKVRNKPGNKDANS